MKLRAHWLLRLFGFHPARADASVEQPIGMWVKCFWWRMRAGK